VNRYRDIFDIGKWNISVLHLIAEVGAAAGNIDVSRMNIKQGVM